MLWDRFDLLEAHSLGLEAYGCDINSRMVGMTQNLAYFGYTPQVQLIDALLPAKAEALVTDMPYGRFQIKEEKNIRGILERCAYLAPAAVFVAGEDLSNWIADSGYFDIEIYPVVKSAAFQRLIHRAQSKVFDPTDGRISQPNLT
jgi:tRNA G10  N-methylase Trm11